jgi:hypothetical protein
MKTAFAKLFFATLVASIGTIEATTVMENLNNSAEKTSAYLSENLDILNSINQQMGNENSISSVENIFKVTAINEDETTETAYLSDFKNNEGYYLLADEYNLLDWQINVEQPFHQYMNTNYEFYFDVANASYYIKKDGIFVSVLGEDDSLNTLEANNPVWKSQDTNYAGYGSLINADEYIKEAYDDKYKMVSSSSLNYIPNEGQFELSVYISKGKDGVYSEGNCGVVSVYNALNCYKRNGKMSQLPSETEKVKYVASKEEPALYNKYLSKDNYFVNTSSTFPKLYLDARASAIDIKGKSEGLTIFQSARIFEKTAKKYGYTVDCDTYPGYWKFYTNKVKKKIDDGYASLFSTGTGSYNSHTMCVTGYKVYEKTENFAFLTYTKKVNLLEISDGHHKNPRYYDVTAYNSLIAGYVIISSIN